MAKKKGENKSSSDDDVPSTSRTKRFAPNDPIPPGKMQDYTLGMLEHLSSKSQQTKGLSLKFSRSVWEANELMHNGTGLPYNPTHIRKEFKRYFGKARMCSMLPLQICFGVLSAYFSCEESLELYDDFPKSKPALNALRIYQKDRWKDLKEKNPGLPSFRVSLLATKEWSSQKSTELQDEYRKKLEKQRKKFDKKVGRFFERHPELEDLQKKMNARKQVNEARRPKKSAPPPLTAFDMYKKEKATTSKYAGLTEEDKEAKLMRHFKKLSVEKVKEYAESAKEFEKNKKVETTKQLTKIHTEVNGYVEPSLKADVEKKEEIESPKKKKKRKHKNEDVEIPSIYNHDQTFSPKSAKKMKKQDSNSVDFNDLLQL